MAYTKKNTATKRNTTPKTEVETEEVVVKETAPVKEKKKFHSDDPVLCRSVVVGKLCFEGTFSNTVYRWMNYGDRAEVLYKDLVNIVRTHSGYIFSPKFVIEDEDFIDEFPELKKFYAEKYTISELTDILYMSSDEMEHTIKALPKSALEQFINICSTKIAEGSLDSLKKIKDLERILNVDFSLVAGL